MSKPLGNCLSYTKDNGESLVIIYAHVQAIKVERFGLEVDTIDLTFDMRGGVHLVRVTRALAREMLDTMGLEKVPLPEVPK